MATRCARVLGLAVAITLSTITLQGLLRACGSSWDLTANSGPGQVLLYLLALSAVLLFARRERYRLTIRLSGRRFGHAFAPAFLVVLVGYLALFGVGALTRRPEASTALSGTQVGKTALAALIVPLLVCTEEVIFRVFLFGYLRGTKPERRHDLTAAVISSFVFAAVHRFRQPGVWLEGRNPILFVNLFLLGMLLCLVYREGQLSDPAGVHTGVLLPEVLRNQSHLWVLHQDHTAAAVGWLGTNGDLRTAPLTGILFLCLFAVFRSRLSAWLFSPESSPNQSL